MVEDHSREELVEEEAFLIEHSGEIPEVALHGSIHYLTADPDGPCISLTQVEEERLRQAVLNRYRFIILRDLNPRNRDKSIYRGVERAIVNWRRMRKFADKHGYRLEETAREIARAVSAFLERELQDVSSGSRETCLNCSLEELRWFLMDLGAGEERLISEVERVCCLR